MDFISSKRTRRAVGTGRHVGFKHAAVCANAASAESESEGCWPKKIVPNGGRGFANVTAPCWFASVLPGCRSPQCVRRSPHKLKNPTVPRRSHTKHSAR